MRRILPFIVGLIATVAAASESPVNISGVETADLRLYYYNYLSPLVPRAVRSFSAAVAWHRRMLGWTPSEPTIVLLQDFSDIGGAAHSPTPHSTLTFDVGPPSRAFEIFPVSERMQTIMNHELVHVLQADMETEEDRRWRRFFVGKVLADSKNPESMLYNYLTVPRFAAPRWYIEGGAVFLETWMNGGIGRAQGGYDEMVFRTMVRESHRFYDPLELLSVATKVDFQGGANAYLYGTRFFTWLAYAYSPEKVLAWIRRDEGSERYYADQFKRVFGLPLEEAWQQWIAFEHEFQGRNLAELRKFPITVPRQLVPGAMGSVSRLYYDKATGLLYGAYRIPGTVEHIGALDVRSGNVRQIAEIKGATFYRVTSFAYDPASGTAFYANNNYNFRDLMAVDVKTGEVRRLMKEARIGEIVFNPADRSLLGVRHEDGIATLVRIPYPYDRWQKVHSFPWEHVPTDLDVSPDGRLLSASLNNERGQQFLRVWELEKVLDGDMTPLREFDFGQSVPESFTFSRDGRYLYGASYYTGVSNIFRCDVATGKVDAVSNAETGFFRPVPLDDGSLIVLNYTADGFVPATIDAKPLDDVSAIRFLGSEVAEKHPEVKTWEVAVPGPDDKSATSPPAPYVPLQSIALVNAFPVLQGYKDSVGLGYHLHLEDPLYFAILNMTASYTPSRGLPADQRGHVDIAGTYRGWRGALAWNHSDFYDLFGPVKRSRKGYAAKLGYDLGLRSDDPLKVGATFDLAYYDQIDTLPDAQNIQTDFTRLVVGDVTLRYSELFKSLGAIEDEKGLTWSLGYRGNYVTGQVTSQFLGTLDYGIALPAPHASLWLRTAGGVGESGGNQTVARFYLGDFGNNYVDDGPIKRYREFGSFPGFGIDEISALRFVREMVEINAPPLMFKSIGTPGFYFSALRPSVFATGLWSTPASGAAHERYANAGAQFDFSLNVLNRYEMTLSAGAAVGWRGSQRQGSQWMVSLKIM